MKEIRKINKEQLYDLYFKQNKSIKECSQILQCGYNTILRRFKTWGWKFRSRGMCKGARHFRTRHIVDDVDKIKEMYNDGKLCKEISELYNVSANFIEKLLRDNGVVLKNFNARCDEELDLIKDDIIRLYTEDKLSTKEIGEIYNKDAESIRMTLEKLGIGRRSISESLIKFNLDDIDELLKKKNYKRITEYDDFFNINRHNDKMKILCLKHNHTWSARICNIIQGSGCPKCRNKSEGKVHDILEKIIDVEIETQKYICSYSWNDKRCKIRVDFYFEIGNQKYIVEYNGLQHYEEVNVFKNKDMGKQKYRDNSLKKHCDDKGIKLIVIDGRYYKNLYMRQYKKRLKELGDLLCAEFC